MLRKIDRCEYLIVANMTSDVDQPYLRIEEDNGGSFVTFEHSGIDISTELRDLSPGDTSATEVGWQQGVELMLEAWTKSD